VSALDQPWGAVPVAVSLLLVLLAYAALFATAELLRRVRGVGTSTTRPLVHAVGCLLAVPLPLLLGRPLGIAVALVFAAAQAWTRRQRLLLSVHDVDRETYGAVAFPLGIALVALVAQTFAQYAFGVLVLGFADPAAGLVGRRWGTPIRRWPTASSLAGSAAFLAVTLLLAVAFARAGADDPSRPVLLVASGLVVTAVESVLGRGLDNLAVPSAAAVAYAWMFVG
jgi:phytol kinase